MTNMLKDIKNKSEHQPSPTSTTPSYSMIATLFWPRASLWGRSTVITLASCPTALASHHRPNQLPHHWHDKIVFESFNLQDCSTIYCKLICAEYLHTPIKQWVYHLTRRPTPLSTPPMQLSCTELPHDSSGRTGTNIAQSVWSVCRMDAATTDQGGFPQFKWDTEGSEWTLRPCHCSCFRWKRSMLTTGRHTARPQLHCVG